MGVTTKLTLKDYEEKVKAIRERTAFTDNETPAVKKARIARLNGDYNAWAQYYFPHYCEANEDGNLKVAYKKAPVAGRSSDGPKRLIDCAWFQIKFAEDLLDDPNYFGVNEWPREHAKTVHSGLFAPYWLMAHGELDGMAVAAREYGSACNILADIQAEAEGNQKLIADYGEMKSHGNWATGDFEFKNGIFFVAFGLGQNPRGVRKRQRRPNYGLVSDIDDDEMVLNQKRVKGAVRWILGAFFPILRIKRRRFVVEGNRINKQSILAHIVGDITPETPKRKGLNHIKVVAYNEKGVCAWKERFTQADIDAQINIMGSVLGRREYFHEPSIEGSVFKNEWIQWGPVPPLNEMEALVMYCDPSYKGNTTSCFKSIALWGKKGKYYYKIKCFCRQSSNTEMWQWWYDHYDPTAGAYLYMEAIFFQDMLLVDCETEGDVRGWQLPVSPDYRDKPDKLTRIIANMQPLYQRGLVIYNEKERGSEDMQQGKDQLLAIEQGSNHFSDGPDADEGAIWLINQMARSNNWTAPLSGGYTHEQEF